VDAIRRQLVEENERLKRRVAALEQEFERRGPRPGRDEGQSALMAALERLAEVVAEARAVGDQEGGDPITAFVLRRTGVSTAGEGAELVELAAGAVREALANLVRAAASFEAVPRPAGRTIEVGPDGDTDPESGE